MAELNWDYYEGTWTAASGIMDEIAPFTWSIDVQESGMFSVISTEPELLHGVKPLPEFTTFAEAKTWCQERENELVADAAMWARIDAGKGVKAND